MEIFNKIGEDTLPLYITHGFVVHIFISLYSHMKVKNEILTGLILLAVAFIITVLFSNNQYKKYFNKFMETVKRGVFYKHCLRQ